MMGSCIIVGMMVGKIAIGGSDRKWLQAAGLQIGPIVREVGAWRVAFARVAVLRDEVVRSWEVGTSGCGLMIDG